MGKKPEPLDSIVEEAFSHLPDIHLPITHKFFSK
jgi:hypothetical protein